MSVDLLTECKRKLTNGLGKLDKTVQMFDSNPLERCFYETCRAEGVILETREAIQQAREELQKNSVR